MLLVNKKYMPLETWYAPTEAKLGFASRLIYKNKIGIFYLMTKPKPKSTAFCLERKKKKKERKFFVS